MSTDTIPENNEGRPLLGLGLGEGLGLVPERTVFERFFPPPGTVRWNGDDYEAVSDTSYSAERYASKWHAWKVAVAAERERRQRECERMRDALLSIRKHCEPQPSALAAAIVATCDNGLGQPLTLVPPLRA